MQKNEFKYDLENEIVRDPKILGQHIPFSLYQLARMCIIHETEMAPVVNGTGEDIATGFPITMFAQGDHSNDPVIATFDIEVPYDEDYTQTEIIMLRAECIVSGAPDEISVLQVHTADIREFFKIIEQGSPENYLHRRELEMAQRECNGENKEWN